MRLALGVSYHGAAYRGWQSQPDGATVQDHLEQALSRFADRPLRSHCAGRTDTGVHALNQIVHIDVDIERETQSWVRGVNRYLPHDIAIQWCLPVPASFHARYSAHGRRYVYLLLESPVRPSIERGAAGWTFHPLDADRLRDAAARLVGEHDFSAFRSAQCQAVSPVRQLRSIRITRHGAYWRFEFDASAFLHHMVRNLMGGLLAVGQGRRDADWLAAVLAACDRTRAAPTFPAAGLYFAGPYYDPVYALPTRSAAMDWLPG
ncbi:MAG: tRNA pseudouridine(38-40) synthase TruA [Burkholderiaceae bacterium]